MPRDFHSAVGDVEHLAPVGASTIHACKRCATASTDFRAVNYHLIRLRHLQECCSFVTGLTADFLTTLYSEASGSLELFPG